MTDQGERCRWCGHEVSAGSLLGNTLANGALPKLAEHVIRATRLYTDEIGALRDRVAELETLGAARDRAFDAMEGMQIETMLPATWRALTAEQRAELMSMCCRGCGGLDSNGTCCNDE